MNTKWKAKSEEIKSNQDLGSLERKYLSNIVMRIETLEAKPMNMICPQVYNTGRMGEHFDMTEEQRRKKEETQE